jgi:hypothetical protein
MDSLKCHCILFAEDLTITKAHARDRIREEFFDWTSHDSQGRAPPPGSLHGRLTRPQLSKALLYSKYDGVFQK